MAYLRGRPPGRAAGMRGSTIAHSASLKSLGYAVRFVMPRLYPTSLLLSTFLDTLSDPPLRRADLVGADLRSALVQCLLHEARTLAWLVGCPARSASLSQ